MTTIDTAALRAAAEAATVGPWQHRQSGGGYENYVYAPNARYGVSWAGDSPVKVAYLPHDPSGFRDAQDARYIAAASPDVFTALLNRLELAERECAFLHRAATRAVIALAHASEKDKAYARDYEQLSEAIDAHRAAIAALAAKERSNG